MQVASCIGAQLWAGEIVATAGKSAWEDVF